MFAVDDPMLALIVRFVVRDREPDNSDDEFLRRQVNAMKHYLERYPEQEQDAKAIEWIAEYAAEYRVQWQRQRVAQKASETRCMDCPMNAFGEERYCQIHFHWLELLGRYSRNELSSTEYVKAALRMLREHKQELIIRKQHEAAERRQLNAYRNSRNRPL